MKSILILIGSRVVNGLFGLLLFVLIKVIISNDGYAHFSASFANLSLLSTFAGGVLGGLLLKNAFYFGSAHHRVIYFYIAFFAALIVVPLELAFYVDAFSELNHLTVYIFIASHLLSSVTLIHYQLKQRFGLMAVIEISRTVLPLVLVLLLKYGFNILNLSVNEVIMLMAMGNAVGVVLLIFVMNLSFAGELISISAYLKERLKADLSFGFSFGSFNALAQFIIARDRTLILTQAAPVQAANIAYTADQVTKVSNGVLFPLNTKVSSELGALVRNKEEDHFYKQLKVYSVYTFCGGAVITLLGYLIAFFFTSQQLVADLNGQAILYYGGGNTVYLTCLVYQKRFDYTKYKLLPTLLLVVAAAIALVGVNLFTTMSYFLLTALLFGLFLVVAGFILPSRKLILDK
jgi:O-antigen/teichoic acid export membrane protein